MANSFVNDPQTGELDVEATMRAATSTGILVAADDGGIMFRWSDAPYDFTWQTYAQAKDLIDKLNKALGR